MSADPSRPESRTTEEAKTLADLYWSWCVECEPNPEEWDGNAVADFARRALAAVPRLAMPEGKEADGREPPVVGLLRAEKARLRARVEELEATMMAAWIDGYVQRSMPGASRGVINEAYRRATEMPDAEMLRQLWGDPRVPAPRGVLAAPLSPTGPNDG